MGERKRYICKRCGYEFEEIVVSAEEARDKNMQRIRIKCPKCGNFDLDKK